MKTSQLANNIKKASKKLMSLDAQTKTKIFDKIIFSLQNNKGEIIAENEKDLAEARKSNLSAAMLDRLKLTPERIDQMVAGVEQIKNQKEVVGEFYDSFKNDIGLEIKKQRVPLGVILMIFESRPNVVVDCAALAIKSSNAIILKGGKEAKYSNTILGNLIQSAIGEFIPKEVVTTLQSDSREEVNELLSLKDDIDVVIPRGGEGLVKFVTETAAMPVIAHFKGLCHMYIDESADLDKAVKLVVNAKTQRTGVCNAIETLLVHEKILPKLAPILTEKLMEKSCELRVDEDYQKNTDAKLKAATDEDWATEYLENILSIKTVKNVEEAIAHIDEFGSFHSECIVSEDKNACDKFLSSVDASCIMVNASTRFNDGGSLGLGAELGISTTKLHAYGPMGVEQMTTSRYVIMGYGQIRG